MGEGGGPGRSTLRRKVLWKTHTLMYTGHMILSQLALAVVVLWGIAHLTRAFRQFHGEVIGQSETLTDLVGNIGDQLGALHRLDSLEARQHELVEEFTRLDAVCDSLPVRWEEMYAKVRRTEERARGSVRRALEELEEAGLRSGELEGTLEEIRREYGERSEPSGVQPVRENLGSNGADEPPPSLNQLALRVKYGGDF